ncbi:DUF320 domain-containing protein [Kitasatospora xanthocidica]|uniref:DUF320 domain-containing protein n=1 Tax=Kitasatospora xanthocidica TaxID=83382 RepID=A0A372ZSA2_9ACTN|nr:DUF320 domain-containing protein [Kitasatospora xanthocidica]
MRKVAKKGILTAVATGSVLASTAGYAYAGGADAQGVATGSPGVVSGNSVQVPIEVPINACGNTIDVIGLLNPSFGNRCANVSGGGHQAPKPAHGGQSGATGAGRTDGSSASGSQGATAPASTLPASTLPASTLPASAVPDAAGPATKVPGADGTGVDVPGAGASGVAANSAGVLSGNSVQAPVDVPVNACGNSVNVAGVGNPAFGNDCANVEKVEKVTPTPPAEGCVETCPTPPQTSSEEVTSVARTGVAPATSASAAVAPAAKPAPSAQLATTGAGNVELLGAAGLAMLLGGGVLYRRARAGAR